MNIIYDKHFWLALTQCPGMLYFTYIASQTGSYLAVLLALFNYSVFMIDLHYLSNS